MPRRTVGGALGELAARGEVGLVRCRQCDFELVEPRPDDLALAGFYEAQDYTAHEPVDDAAAVRRAEHQLAQVEAAGGGLQGAAVLDVGCGGGQFLVAARRRCAQVVGWIRRRTRTRRAGGRGSRSRRSSAIWGRGASTGSR